MPGWAEELHASKLALVSVTHVKWPESAERSSKVAATCVPRLYALVWPLYGAVVLAIDTRVGVGGERILGVATWLALLVALLPLPRLARAQAIGVVLFATVGEVAGSIFWGVYRYRLHDLPLFVPPGHGLVYLSGLALARVLGERRAVPAAAVASLGWGIAGLTASARPDVAGAIGVALLGLFLWRSRARASYAGVFFVVAALEWYGTAIGVWRWRSSVPGLGIADGNPPSGAASGYVWFDVMALLLAPWLVYVARKARLPEPSLAKGAVRDVQQEDGAAGIGRSRPRGGGRRLRGDLGPYPARARQARREPGFPAHRQRRDERRPLGNREARRAVS
jgi:hypothetical protein